MRTPGATLRTLLERCGLLMAAERLVAVTFDFWETLVTFAMLHPVAPHYNTLW